MTTAEREALKVHQPALDRLMHFYDFGAKAPWTFDVVRCPLITGHVVMHFKSVEVSEGSSEFVAILPQHDGRVRLVPLWHRGLRSFDAPYKDPHNIAIFNETLAHDGPHLRSSGDWLQLAVCYLAMVGDWPNVLLSTNLSQQLGDVSPRAVERMVPIITTSKSSVEVAFYDSEERTRISEWHLTFDIAGLLREVSCENHEKSDLLKP
jgi:hypothetical protein